MNRNNVKLEDLPRICTPRLSYKPFEYPQFMENGWFAQKYAFWLHTEVPMNEDIDNWNNDMSIEERNIASRILKGFAQTECEVNFYWAQTVSKWFPKPEIVAMAIGFADQETIHAEGYSYLNETLSLDDFEAFLQDEETMAKLDFLININEENSKERNGVDLEAIATSLFAFSGIAEGTLLFSSFMVLLSFQPRNMLKGIGQIIAWSVRDESLHSNMGIELFNTLCREVPELRESIQERIYEACDIALELETNFINQVFEEIELPNLTRLELINFIKYRLNDRLVLAGYPIKYQTDKIMLERLAWFDQIISGVEVQDFLLRCLLIIVKRQKLGL